MILIWRGERRAGIERQSLVEAFGLRALAYAYYGGADLGECFSTVDRIGSGNNDYWHQEWTNTVERLLAIAKTAERGGHVVSAREAYFRASSYFRVSYIPLFGSPVDPRLTRAFQQETDAFESGARLNDFPTEPVEIPFEGRLLPGYFCRVLGNDAPRPTLLWVSGYDSDIREDYFAHAPAAIRRGYNCLVVDGPGQGRNLIRDNSSTAGLGNSGSRGSRLRRKAQRGGHGAHDSCRLELRRIPRSPGRRLREAHRSAHRRSRPVGSA